MLTVAICQYIRNDPDRCVIEVEDGARSDKRWPASISKKRRRRRKKNRKTKSEEIEEVESFEEDMAPLQMDAVGTGGGLGSEQLHVDDPKVSGLCRILCLATRRGVQQLHLLSSFFRLFISFASTSCFSSYPLRPLLIANAMQIKFVHGPFQNK